MEKDLKKLSKDEKSASGKEASSSKDSSDIKKEKEIRHKMIFFIFSPFYIFL